MPNNPSCIYCAFQVMEAVLLAIMAVLGTGWEEASSSPPGGSVNTASFSLIKKLTIWPSQLLPLTVDVTVVPDVTFEVDHEAEVKVQDAAGEEAAGEEVVEVAAGEEKTAVPGTV